MVTEVTKTCSCDICGGKDAESHSFFYDRRGDGAGSMDNEYYDIDLCAAHFAELVRIHGDPAYYRQRIVGRSAAMSYGFGVKSWAEMQEGIWEKMSAGEKKLWFDIAAL